MGGTGSRARKLLRGINAWPARGPHEAYLFALAAVIGTIALVLDAPADPWWSPWNAAFIFAVGGLVELTKRLVEHRRQHLVAIGAAPTARPITGTDWVIVMVAILFCGSGVGNTFWPDSVASVIVGVVQIGIGVWVTRVAWRRLRGPGIAVTN